MAKGYWINFFHSVSDPDKVEAYRKLAGPVFVFAGAMHFVIPKAYRRIMPPYVPAHEAMVYASGVAEIVGGAGLMVERTRRPAPGTRRPARSRQ